MKKSFLYLLLAVVLGTFVGCEETFKPTTEEIITPGLEPETGSDTGKGTESDSEVIPTQFVKKHLIEEHTGQTCGNCPRGAKQIEQFMSGKSNWILIMWHDFGESDDVLQPREGNGNMSRFNGSSKGFIAAPMSSVDRIQVNSDGGSSGTFYYSISPSSIGSVRVADSTYASIKIENTFDASSHQLTVKVSGLVLKEDAPDLYLMVLVKESGVKSWQYGASGSNYNHICLPRTILTKPYNFERNPTNLGDKITPTPNSKNVLAYSKEYTTTLDSKWNADNCMVVAILTETQPHPKYKYALPAPVVQVEEAPVVKGTSGGADQKAG